MSARRNAQLGRHADRAARISNSPISLEKNCQYESTSRASVRQTGITPGLDFSSIAS
jgi:hypothetical protein